MDTATIKVSRADFQRIITFDQSPDLSYLGEYFNRPATVHIDRKARGEQGRNEFRYFNAGCGDPDYIEQDYKRHEAYNAGQWQMVGVRASINIIVEDTIQTIQSAGLWGIESDSGDTYFAEVYAEECSQLTDILNAMGVEVLA